MLRKLQKILRGEKGQSLVEWALVALFVVGIVYMFRNAQILPQVSNAYNGVGSYLSSTPTSEQAINKYGALSNSELREAVSNQERIAMDDATLRNIAGAFLGKTQTEIRAMLMSQPNWNAKYDRNALNQGTLLFDYYINSTGDGENGSVKTRFDNGVVAKDNLVNWMQGNYTQYPSTQKQMESDNRYFFSDDLIYTQGVYNHAIIEANKNDSYAVSVRCAFEFDKTTGKAKAIQIWATRNAQAKDGSWIRDMTQGINGDMSIRVE
jgi:hypothetical protein